MRIDCGGIMLKSFLKSQYSLIPLFRIIALIAPVLFIGCSATQRFGKGDNGEESHSRYEKSESYNEDKNIKPLETVKGIASYYADKYHGKQTSNGEIYDMYGLTAAHKTYPFNTIVRVTNLSNGKSVKIRINDRMPDYNPRIIDLSYGAAIKLDMLTSGIAEVKLEVLKWGK